MLTMGQKPLEIGDFDRHLVTLITSVNVARGGTIRSLASASGISRARVDRILRGVSSMSTTDLQRICDALDLIPWKIALAAETGCNYEEVAAELERRLGEDTTGEALLRGRNDA